MLGKQGSEVPMTRDKQLAQGVTTNPGNYLAIMHTLLLYLVFVLEGKGVLRGHLCA